MMVFLWWCFPGGVLAGSDLVGVLLLCLVYVLVVCGGASVVVFSGYRTPKKTRSVLTGRSSMTYQEWTRSVPKVHRH